MTQPMQRLLAFQDAPPIEAQHLEVRLAAAREEVRAAQRLRYRIFAEELGARLPGTEPGIDTDALDAYCDHLIVRRRDTADVVGCCRILTDAQAYQAGRYSSQTEFDLTRLLPLPGRVIEVGRGCVHADYRNGATIRLLWRGLARYIVDHDIGYLMGCASIPLTQGTLDAQLIYARLARSYLAPPGYRTFPKVPLPRVQLAGIAPTPHVPPLMQAYLRAGAQICGEPAWNPAFNVAELFLLLRTDAMTGRYRRRFLERS